MRTYFKDIERKYRDAKDLPFEYNEQVIEGVITLLGEKWRDRIVKREEIARKTPLYGPSIIYGNNNIIICTIEYKRGIIMWAKVIKIFDLKMKIVPTLSDDEESSGYDEPTIKNMRVIFGKPFENKNKTQEEEKQWKTKAA